MGVSVASGVSPIHQPPAAPSPQGARRRAADVLTLAALPLLLLLVNPSWLSSALFLDPYLYFGYYLDLPGHLSAFPDHYISSRLPALLPGWAAHSLLPTAAANAVLHLG